MLMHGHQSISMGDLNVLPSIAKQMHVDVLVSAYPPGTTGVINIALYMIPFC
ncbi:hypothetical protein FIBSPDRAFT_173102 [Athelia psychrophila]|uniref:Uncharacterized protein n=1 Tax=Athelia psychrophila TaxID=1759441 RepID=A0A166AS09_9AGAM|nr:hypothetical protein FIBSPDRAFT_173102 [Fibularhizoctonia sp. CBS 109695]